MNKPDDYDRDYYARQDKLERKRRRLAFGFPDSVNPMGEVNDEQDFNNHPIVKRGVRADLQGD